MLIIKNGFIIDPYTRIEAKKDILIDDSGVITEIEEDIICEQADVFDAEGFSVVPGFVDVHVHFRDPGFKYKEDIITGAAAAVAGGYTSVICMANTKPVCDNIETLAYILNKAKSVPINVLQAVAVTKGLLGKELVDFDKLHKKGAVGFTDDGINITDRKLCKEAMENIARLNVPISFHEEDPEYIINPGINANSEATKKLGIAGAYRQAEEKMIKRDIELALETKAKVNFQHISSQGSVKLIKEGKKKGARIFAEVTPHHISLTDKDVLKYGTLAKMNPPVRTEEDRKSLIQGLKDGTIDIIATDHAPHTSDEKDKEFEKAPSGIIGLETAFSVCNTYLVKVGEISKMQLVEKMSVNPAKLYNLKNKEIKIGNKAEIAIVSWSEKKIYKSYKSKADNTPFTNRELYGSIKAVVIGRKIVK